MLHSLLHSYRRAGVAALALQLTGCGPSHYLTMQPTRPDGPAGNGPAASPASSHYLADDSVEVKLKFVRYQKQELVFEVEVGNDSRRPVRVVPETFYYVPLDTTVATASAAMLPARVNAIDPEVRLGQMTERLARHARKAEGTSWLEVLTTINHVVEDVSSITKEETDQQIAERDARQEAENARFDEERAEHAKDAESIYKQRQIMETIVLRKSTVGPGQYALGQIYFPRTDAARRLRVVVFYNERPVTFDFTQKPSSR